MPRTSHLSSNVPQRRTQVPVGMFTSDTSPSLELESWNTTSISVKNSRLGLSRSAYSRCAHGPSFIS
ncbi:hypothetical protein M378DRAFT_167352 [Amanita muscaria Koide BX008]|uniref:Uncharacterized protein n=1 Tax=Amanita muscaria (strain Koide BX008) TaxID=946122 RepID=A0A0C2WI53_AMAMK|nr:hypothetical protein M378DRAFT_167352 [Amanita muscaria Koide BX008]